MANSSVNPYGTTRGASEVVAATQGQEVELVLNQRGDTLAAQALAPYAETVRMGNTWTTSVPTANAFTYVNAWPTTRGEIVLYNGEAANGKCYVIDAAWVFGITSMAAAQPIALLAQLVPVVATVPTDNTACLIRSHSGKASYNGRAKRAIANTAAGQTTNLWSILATGLVPAPTTNLGAAVFAEINGMFIVPPGGVFALAAVAGTAAGTAIIGVQWTEIQLTLG